MDLKQMEYFQAVADAGSISEAARRLHVAQPPVSYQMKTLENELGVQLFERGARHIRLTKAGHIFYTRVTRILEMADNAARDTIRAGKGQTLYLGMTSTTVSIIQPVLKRFATDHPDVHYQLYDGSTFELRHLLDTGVIEGAVLRTPFPVEECNCRLIRTEPMLAGFPAQWSPRKARDAEFPAAKFAAAESPTAKSPEESISDSPEESIPGNSGRISLSELSRYPLSVYRRYYDLIHEQFTAQQIPVQPLEGFGPEEGEKAEPIAMGRQTLWGGLGKPPSREVMQAAAREDVIIAAHCEDNTLLHGGYIHDGRYAAAHGHKGICSESEWGQIARDLKLAEETGCAYHVCHISTKESVRLIREAKARGLDVSCETAPHYLLLDENDLQEDGRFKMNPPLRAREDREALIEGLLDGTIDCIATDHAPHSAAEKARGLAGSAFGIVGIETAFPLLYTYLVKPGILSLEALLAHLVTIPRARFGIPQGDDFTVWDLNADYTIDPEDFLSMGKATPFEGWHVNGKCLLTVCGGRAVYMNTEA